jgi:hypothetical protein
MTPKKPILHHPASSYEVTLMVGLSDLEQAEIARRYEQRTGRSFKCFVCGGTGTARWVPEHATASEPASQVVAILERDDEITPVCETCYQTIMDEAETG